MGVDGGDEKMQEPTDREEKIFVSVRLRPLNEKEIARNDASDWECINENTIIYRNNLSVSERSMYPSAYTFDRVFSSNCSTRKVYEEGAKEVALSVVSGINSSVFAYGQTSSGKTYTMSGITEYAMADIYEYMERHKEREFILKFSALEIYNESVRDLLSSDSTPLRLLDDPERGTTVERLTEETLRDWNHFKELLSICEAQRQIGETSLNETSSRSHQILRVTIESSAREFLGNENSSTVTATVNFVDLAGSERASQTLSAGTRLKEGCHINRSLLTLGTVIRKLSKGRNGHIPFRDSKLTRILQSSLGGNARTSIICTQSPARSHVEQSRNTLLFASCAKEVTTNAQVNVVMSDKALVKQLQRELARLQNELRSSGVVSIPSDTAALLRQKDLEIEKLKKENMDLTQQLEIVRSEVEDLQQVVRDEKPTGIWADLDPQYPKLRVRSSNSWDYENSVSEPASVDNHFQGVSVRSLTPSQFSDRQSSSSEESFIQLPPFKVNTPHSSYSSHASPNSPNFIGSNVLQKENGEHVDDNSEDPCKEVQCVDAERLEIKRDADLNVSQSSPIRSGNSNMSSPRINTATPVLTDIDNDDRSNGGFTPQISKESNDSNSMASGKPSPWLLETELSSCRSVKITRSRSCKASLMSGLSSPWSEREGKNVCTPPLGYQREYSGRPDSFQRKYTALRYCVDDGFSRNGSKNSSSTAAVYDQLKSQNVTGPNEKQHADHAVQVNESAPTGNKKTVKDVGLDPIQDESEDPSIWPSKFKRLQEEIIELWHACNVSLVHRTYFFLLFKGDPKDYIYMEVELRRLSFLKDTFSQGNQTVEDGKVISPASSERAVRRERNMLSQRMKKRLSREERENLFLKWGIALNTKDRRMKLAQRLWSDVKDMNHVAESAAIVAKLVGFVDSEQTFKELFGLNFAPRRRSSKKYDRLKRSVMSIL